jgi:hypothetical protein
MWGWPVNGSLHHVIKFMLEIVTTQPDSNFQQATVELTHLPRILLYGHECKDKHFFPTALLIAIIDQVVAV